MTFEVRISARADPAVRRLLTELVGDSALRTAGEHLVIRVIDQPAMVAVVTRLNDLGVEILQVCRAGGNED
jgi:hypothetical protein